MFYLRVLPTLILFAHSQSSGGAAAASSSRFSSTNAPVSAFWISAPAYRMSKWASARWTVIGWLGGWVGGALPCQLAFMFNSCANCRGNLASSVLNTVRCFWFMAQLVPPPECHPPPSYTYSVLYSAPMAWHWGPAVNFNSKMKLLPSTNLCATLKSFFRLMSCH